MVAAERNRALVIRAGALGDLLLLRGAIASLKRGGYAVSLLAPSYPAQALVGEGEGDVDEVVDWEGAQTATLFARNESLEGRLGACLSRCDCALVYCRQASLIRAIEKHVPCVLSRDPRPTPGRRAFEWYAEIVSGLGLPFIVPTPCQADAFESAPTSDIRRSLPDGFLAVHPGSGSTYKNWPIDRFMRLVEAVSQGQPWLLVEGPAERGRLYPLSAISNVIVASDLPLRVLGALLAESGVYVGNDSGVTHLAAAWGATTVALFGPTDSTVFSPVGKNVFVVNAPGNDIDALDASGVIETTIRARRQTRERVR